MKFKILKNESRVYSKARKRLETVPSEEVVRYTDNLHSATGMTISNIRKSLTNPKADEAVVHIADLKNAAYTLLAAADVLELRQ